MPLRNYLANTKRSANGNNFGFVPFLRLVAFVTKDMLSMHCVFHFRVYSASLAIWRSPSLFIALCFLLPLSLSLKLKCGFNIQSSPKLCRTLSKHICLNFQSEIFCVAKCHHAKHTEREIERKRLISLSKALTFYHFAN